MSNLKPIDQVRVMAKSASASKLFSAKAEEQVFTLMLIAQAENIHPMKALMAYDIIQGQPALKASEALARFMDCGGKIKWIKSDSESAKAEINRIISELIVINTKIEIQAIKPGSKNFSKYQAFGVGDKFNKTNEWLVNAEEGIFKKVKILSNKS